MEEIEKYQGRLQLALSNASFNVDPTSTSSSSLVPGKSDFFFAMSVFSVSKHLVAKFTSKVYKVASPSTTTVLDEELSAHLACRGPLLIYFECFQKHKIHRAHLLGKALLELISNDLLSSPLQLPIFDIDTIPQAIHSTNDLKQGKQIGHLTVILNFIPTTDLLASDSSPKGLTSKVSSKYDGLKEKMRPKYPVYKYDQVVEDLDTGDVIMFHGIEPHSKLIEAGCLAYWSHACILIRSPSDEIKELFGVTDYHHILHEAGTKPTDDPKEDVYVLESDYLTIDQRDGGGVQLVPLKAWLLDYEAYYSRMYCVIRRLVNPKRTGNTSLDYPRLEGWMKETAQKLYKTSRGQCVRAVAKLNRREDLTSIFCSELVAATLKYMDLLPADVNCTNVTPKDFDSVTYQSKIHLNHWGKQDFELLSGCYLLQPFRIVYNLAKYTEKVAQQQQESPTFKKRTEQQ